MQLLEYVLPSQPQTGWYTWMQTSGRASSFLYHDFLPMRTKGTRALPVVMSTSLSPRLEWLQVGGVRLLSLVVLIRILRLGLWSRRLIDEA